MQYILLALFLVLLIWFVKVKIFKKSTSLMLPPGPSGFPFVGNIFQVLFGGHIRLSQWADKFGNLYTLKFPGTQVLVINDAKTMRHIFGTMESTGKLNMEIFNETFKGANGVSVSEGEVWKEQRAFFLKAFKECGFNKSSIIEGIVLSECSDLLSWLKNQANLNSNSVVKLRKRLIFALSNVNWRIITRDSADMQNSNVSNLVINWFDLIQLTTKSGLALFPWLKHIAPKWSGYNDFSKVCADLDKTVRQYFDAHKAARLEKGNTSKPKDLFDAYLDQVELCQNPNSSFFGEVGWKHSFYSVMGILLGGGESTATLLNWIINYMIAFPHVQTKLQAEVDTILGTTQDPCLQHKAKMPYLESVVLETLRMSSFAPFGVIHRLLDDLNYNGYLFPKDMLLVANVYHANNDRNVWGDPENFRPERFLEGSETHGQKLKESMATFQLGKRMCPGENLAKDALFLFAAKLVQQVEFLPDSNCTGQDYTNPEKGFFLLPPQTGIKIILRNN